MLTKAIRIEQQGEPEVMQWQDIDLPEPGPDEVLVRHTAVGLNYIDTYHRSGHYKLPLPSGLGSEAAGIIESVGANVTRFKPGGPSRLCWGFTRRIRATSSTQY